MTVVMDFEEGTKACLTHFHDVTYMDAKFPASTEELKHLLPSKKLHPIESAEGITNVEIGAFEYRLWYSPRRGTSPLPPYNEWTVNIPVRYVSDEKPIDGSYVVWMPVTHELPMKGGIELWGFNKFISDIKFTEDKSSRVCEVNVEGKKVVRFSVKKSAGVEKQDDIYVFNKMGDKLTWTLVQMKGSVGVSDRVGSAEIELGDHLIAKQLASIGVESKSVESKYGVNLMANLHALSKTYPI